MCNDKVLVKRKSCAKCSAIDCNHRRNTHDCQFSVFPSSYDKCRKWLKVVGVKDFVSLPITKLSTVRFICSCHFKPEDYRSIKSGKRLRNDAIPSIFSEKTIPLTDSELDEFSIKMPSTIIATDKIVLSIDEIKKSTKYNFHNIFNKLTKNQVVVQSTVKELNTSEKSTIKCMELETADSLITSKPPTQNIICLNDEPTSSLSLNENADQAAQMSAVEFESIKPSKSKKTSYHVRDSEAVLRNTRKLIMGQAGLKGVPISPDYKKLISVVQKERREKNHLQEMVNKQKELIDKLSSSKSQNNSSIKSPFLQKFIEIENKNGAKKPQGHRFSLEQKLISLSLAKHNNNSYRLLRTLMPSLPSKRTHNRLLEKMSMKPVTNTRDKVSGKRKTYSKCSAIDCNHKKNTHDCVFSVFPSCYDRCRSWLKVVGIKDFVSLPITKLTTKRFICSCHFKPEDYRFTKAGKRLRKDAIPSIFSENTIPLTDSELDEFSKQMPSAMIATDEILLSIEEIEKSTKHNFHNMFNQVTEKKIDGQSMEKELITPRKRTIPTMELETADSLISLKQPTPKRICLNDEPISSLSLNDNQSAQIPMVEFESTKSSKSDQTSNARNSELSDKAFGGKLHIQKKIKTSGEQLNTSTHDKIIPKHMYISFVKKLKKCIWKLHRPAAEEVLLKLNEIVDKYEK
ncbi:unnamed protein product [Euphydryas editha]|uniref:THAP-type domain-containing protein n=1 Tax=Euphydryas editha TaxID=104508 RepID=A0AAU9TMS4_EUPED|nr:unnamed protein product [Euphydryas editha]